MRYLDKTYKQLKEEVEEWERTADGMSPQELRRFVASMSSDNAVLLAEIEALKAERDAYKQAYEQAMLAGSDDTTADSFNEYYLAQASDDAFDTPAFVSCEELEGLKAELTDITEPIPYMDDEGEVA